MENNPIFKDQIYHVVIEIDYDDSGALGFNCLGDTCGLHDLTDKAYENVKHWLDDYLDYACNRGGMYNEY